MVLLPPKAATDCPLLSHSFPFLSIITTQNVLSCLSLPLSLSRALKEFDIHIIIITIKTDGFLG